MSEAKIDSQSKLGAYVDSTILPGPKTKIDSQRNWEPIFTIRFFSGYRSEGRQPKLLAVEFHHTVFSDSRNEDREPKGWAPLKSAIRCSGSGPKIDSQRNWEPHFIMILFWFLKRR